MSKIASVEDHKLSAAYESLRATLRAPRRADRLERPLAFWALAGDRRLPMALLGYPLKHLLSKSFDELSATPGIGKKKLHSFIKLLHRATKDQSLAMPLVEDEPADKGKAARGVKSRRAGFNPAVVSELLWEQWCATVRRYGLEHETLGRLAPSLERLPTVIWRTPLAEYIDSTVAEIRSRKTHGEKRVRAILEVFYSVHETLAHVPDQAHLRIDVRPKFTVPIEQWIADVVRRSQPPAVADLKQRIVLPIVAQLRIDAGPTVHRLVEERLGINSPPHRVQQQAKRLGITRARVYQLFEMCGDVMAVRWPEGAELFRELHERLASFPGARPQLVQLRALVDLIYPELEYRGRVAEHVVNKASSKDRGAARGDGHPHHRRGSIDHHGRSNGAPARFAAARQ